MENTLSRPSLETPWTLSNKCASPPPVVPICERALTSGGLHNRWRAAMKFAQQHSPVMCVCVRGHSGHQHVMCQQRCHAAAGWLFIILSVYENPFVHTQIIMREAWGRKARAARDPSHRRCQISKASSEWEFYDRRRNTQMNTDCSDVCVCVTSSEFIQMHESPAGLIYEKGMLYMWEIWYYALGRVSCCGRRRSAVKFALADLWIWCCALRGWITWTTPIKWNRQIYTAKNVQNDWKRGLNWGTRHSCLSEVHIFFVCFFRFKICCKIYFKVWFQL